MLHVRSITSSDLRLLRITITWSDAGLIPSEAVRAWGVDIVTHKTLLLKFVIRLDEQRVAPKEIRERQIRQSAARASA